MSKSAAQLLYAPVLVMLSKHLGYFNEYHKQHWYFRPDHLNLETRKYGWRPCPASVPPLCATGAATWEFLPTFFQMFETDGAVWVYKCSHWTVPLLPLIVVQKGAVQFWYITMFGLRLQLYYQAIHHHYPPTTLSRERERERETDVGHSRYDME